MMKLMSQDVIPTTIKTSIMEVAMYKIKTMDWHDTKDEQGWGKITPTASGIVYRYRITGSDGSYLVIGNPITDDIRLSEITKKGFSTIDNAKYWAHEHNCKQIEKWLV